MSLKCPCEVDAIHEEHEVDGVKVTLDIDIKDKGLIQIRAEEQKPPEQYFDNKIIKPLPATAGYAIICEYCPICGRKLKEEKETQRPYKEYQDLRTGENVREYKEE